MKYHLVTFSQTVDGIAYFDGVGFSRLKENGRKYPDVIAIVAGMDVSDNHSNIEVIPLPIAWSRAQSTEFMQATIGRRMELLKKWQRSPTGNPHKGKKWGGRPGTAKKKAPGVSIQHKYLAKLQRPGKRAVTTEFWSTSDARAKNYATGLLLRKNPGAKCVSLMQTAQTRRVKKKVKK